MTRENKTLDRQTNQITTAEGMVGRRVRPIEFLVPLDVRLEQDRLVWTETQDELTKSPRYMHVTTAPETIDDFLKLHSAKPEEILRYAKQWGPIGFCKHGLPASHNSQWRLDRTQVKMCTLLRGTSEFSEPLEFWRETSKRARALLNIAANLYANKSGKEEDWKIVESKDSHPGNTYDWPIENQRFELEWQLTYWMRMGRLMPLVTFDKNVLTFSLEVLNGSGLFGSLALQLALAASRTDGLGTCSACGRAYIPTRKPNANRRNYCPDCRDEKKPLRDAQRAYRLRKQ